MPKAEKGAREKERERCRDIDRERGSEREGHISESSVCNQGVSIR